MKKFKSLSFNLPVLLCRMLKMTKFQNFLLISFLHETINFKNKSHFFFTFHCPKQQKWIKSGLPYFDATNVTQTVIFLSFFALYECVFVCECVWNRSLWMCVCVWNCLALATQVFSWVRTWLPNGSIDRVFPHLWKSINFCLLCF
jgi:hypothetical protein